MPTRQKDNDRSVNLMEILVEQFMSNQISEEQFKRLLNQGNRIAEETIQPNGIPQIENKQKGKSKTKATGTREWASFTMSCYKGCGNGCYYCWALADKIQKNKKQDPSKVTVDNRTTPEKRDWKLFVNAFRDGQRKHGEDCTIIFPGTHDITIETIDYSLKAIRYMLERKNGNHRLLIVTKPNLDCVKRLCGELEEDKGRILFRFTIGSNDDDVLRFWEPDTPLYQERLESLKYAFEQGFGTSVSCEPPLDGNISEVVEDVYDYVTDGIWLGKPNKFAHRLKCNGMDDRLHLIMTLGLESLYTDEKVMELYEYWNKQSKVRWKNEVKKVVGIAMNEEVGMDK